MLDAPAQIDGHVAESVELVHRQLFLPKGGQVPNAVVHLQNVAGCVLCAAKDALGDGVRAVRPRHKADCRHLFQQSLRAVFQRILQLIPIEGENLIKMDVLAAGQGADCAARRCAEWFCQQRCTKPGVGCKGLLMVDDPAPAQPCAAGGKAGQVFQQLNRPVPPVVLAVPRGMFPGCGQRKGQFCPLLFVFRQFLWHVHPVGPHPQGDQDAAVLLPGGGRRTDVQAEVGGNQFMEHMLHLAEILPDVPADSLSLLPGVDAGDAAADQAALMVVNVHGHASFTSSVPGWPCCFHRFGRLGCGVNRGYSGAAGKLPKWMVPRCQKRAHNHPSGYRQTPRAAIKLIYLYHSIVCLDSQICLQHRGAGERHRICHKNAGIHSALKAQ